MIRRPPNLTRAATLYPYPTHFRAAFARRDGAVRMDIWWRVDDHADMRDRAEAVLEDVGLADKRHREAGTLSRGDKRRLELAMCLVQDRKSTRLNSSH